MNNITLDKAQQLEKLIAKIETRLQGKFITEEQWKFVLDRLTILEKKAEKQTRKRENTLTAQIQQLLYEAHEGLTISEIVVKTEKKPEIVSSIVFHLKKQGIVTSQLLGGNKKQGARYFYNRKNDHGTNRK